MSGLGRLDGKVAVVTGASQGIGRAIAVAFANEGAQVVAAARNVVSLEETAALGGGRIVTQPCDVRRETDVAALVQRAVDEFGGLDVVCNNAGIARQQLLVDTTAEMFDETMETNVRGTFFGIKYAIPAMTATGRGGSIVNVGSINSFVGEKLSSAYVASKGAVLMLTKNAAAECAELGIRVNIVLPGSTDTNMAHDFFEAAGGKDAANKWISTYQPLTGMIPPEDIASVAVFLASNDSRSMTGTSILVDGGLMAHWDHIPE